MHQNTKLSLVLWCRLNFGIHQWKTILIQESSLRWEMAMSPIMDLVVTMQKINKWSNCGPVLNKGLIGPKCVFSAAGLELTTWSFPGLCCIFLWAYGSWLMLTVVFLGHSSLPLFFSCTSEQVFFFRITMSANFHRFCFCFCHDCVCMWGKTVTRPSVAIVSFF